jgi:hypothetical protein
VTTRNYLSGPRTRSQLAFDNFAMLERDFGVSRDKWSREQWEAAAIFLNQSVELIEKTSVLKEQTIEHLERLLSDALSKIPKSKKRGRPRTRYVNVLWRPRHVGRPRTYSPAEDLELINSITLWREHVAREQSHRGRVTDKDAIDRMLRAQGVSLRARRSEISKLQKRLSSAKRRIAKLPGKSG